MSKETEERWKEILANKMHKIMRNVRVSVSGAYKAYKAYKAFAVFQKTLDIWLKENWQVGSPCKGCIYLCLNGNCLDRSWIKEAFNLRSKKAYSKCKRFRGCE